MDDRDFFAKLALGGPDGVTDGRDGEGRRVVPGLPGVLRGASPAATLAEMAAVADAVRERAFALARDAGYRPASLQRPVEALRLLAALRLVGGADFRWADARDRSVDAMIVGPGPDGWTAIHSGQHRILAGLLLGKPVPASSLTRLAAHDPTRDWVDPVGAFDIAQLLP